MRIGRTLQRFTLSAPLFGVAMLHAQTPADAAGAAPQAAAEVQGGTVTGVVLSATVADSSGKKPAGAPLPGVTVTATNTLTGRKYTTATDVTGAFRMTIPKNGRYVLRAEFAAFAPVTAEVLLNATQHEGKAEFAMELASRVAARTAQTAGAGTAVAGVTAQTLRRGLQSLAATGVGDADTEDASAGGAAAGAALPTLAALGGGADSSGSDSVAFSSNAGQSNVLAGFNEDEMRDRIQTAIADAQRNGGGQGDIATAVVGLIGGMMGGPGGGGFGGPGGGGPGGGGPGGGGGFGGGGGGFGGRGGGGFRNFNPTQLHGNAYYQAGNAVFDATQFSLTGNALRPDYYTNRYGLALNGSPYIPGLTKPNPKQSVFLNFTGQTSQNPVNTYATVPTLAERAGNFNGLTQTVSGVATPVILYNPATGQPYGNCTSYMNATCNVITSPLSAQAQSLLQYIPTPNTVTEGTGTSAQAYNYQRITTAGTNTAQISSRFTRSFGANATAGRGGRGGGAAGGAQGRQRAQTTAKTLRQSMNAAFTYQHSASDIRGLIAMLDGKTESVGYNATGGYTVGYGRLTNNFTAGVNFSHAKTTNRFTYGSLDPATAAGISIPRPASATPGLYNGVPGLSFTNFTSVNDTNPSDRLGETISVSDVVSWRKGKHNFRFGGDIRRVHTDVIAGTNGLGTFTFTGYATQNPATTTTTSTGSPTGSSFADFLLGAPQNSALQAGVNKIYLREWVYDGYAQDDWRLMNNVTVNVGVRYEYFSPFVEKNNRLVNLDHSVDFSTLVPVQPNQVGPYSGAFPRSLVQPDRTMISPRLGIAWRPKFLKNTVVRAGYGINYNTGQFATFATSLAYQVPFANTQNNVAATQGCGTLLTPGTGNKTTYTLSNAFSCATAGTVTNNYAVNRSYRLGQVQVVNMDIQRTFPLGIVANVGYNASFGGNLDMRRAPNRNVAGLTSNAQGIVYEDSIGESRFNALSVNVRKRLQKGVSVQATYQYGHSIDDASSVNGSGGNTIPQNDKRLDLEFGNSTFDVRHKVTGTYVFELPFGPNRLWFTSGGWVSRSLDGFSISGDYTFATGSYATPQYVNSVAQASTGNNFTLRPDRVFTQPITGAGTIRSWFNAAAFTTPAGVYGTASRNSIELPGTVSTNMSLSKTVALGELRNFEARLTASNVFNTVQYSGVNTTLNSANFGQVTGAAAPRKISLQARYRF